MTAAELLDALRAAAADPDTAGEGFTVQELSEEAHIGVETVRRLLRPLIKEGKVRAARKTVYNMAGVPCPRPSYVLVEEEPKPAAKQRRRRR